MARAVAATSFTATAWFQAYKRLVLQKHPDKSASSTATADFQQLQAAYDVLKHLRSPAAKRCASHCHSAMHLTSSSGSNSCKHITPSNVLPVGCATAEQAGRSADLSARQRLGPSRSMSLSHTERPDFRDIVTTTTQKQTAQRMKRSGKKRTTILDGGVDGNEGGGENGREGVLANTRLRLTRALEAMRSTVAVTRNVVQQVNRISIEALLASQRSCTRRSCCRRLSPMQQLMSRTHWNSYQFKRQQ